MSEKLNLIYRLHSFVSANVDSSSGHILESHTIVDESHPAIGKRALNPMRIQCEFKIDKLEEKVPPYGSESSDPVLRIARVIKSHDFYRPFIAFVEFAQPVYVSCVPEPAFFHHFS